MIAAVFALAVHQEAIKVRLVTDEPEVALQILAKRAKGQQISGDDWGVLFQTEGYRRLKDRELGMKRSFTEEDFQKFILSDDLLKERPALEQTLSSWKRVDISKAAEKSLTYLPAGSQVGASVYFLIKLRKNSFVWDTEKNPAVMLYLDPQQDPRDLEMTIAHEFHHIGYESRSPSAEYKSWFETQSSQRKVALTWLRAFGEGFAVLASAGSVEAEPYAYSTQEVKEAWSKGMAHTREDVELLTRFFNEILESKLTEEQAQTRAMDFYGMVGPWYTVGYTMAASIERAFGRGKLLACYQDPRLLLRTYNEAAQKLGDLPIWPKDLVRRLS
ncbi:MAG: hypothetical protein QOJ65_1974 [Fimbriimonadaceae bacterium]|jgi:hypothetical protein|nr:hypothetical protein [Fimbriimonadaceae bacterium]